MKNMFWTIGERFSAFRKKYPLQTEIILYAAVTLLAKILDMGVMAITRFACQPQLYKSFIDLFVVNGSEFANMLATALGFCVGTAIEYVISTFAVFERNKRGETPFGFAVFILISLGGLGIHLFCMYVANALWGINPYIVKLVVGFFVLAYNYVMKKVVLYTKEKWGKRETTKVAKSDSAQKEKKLPEAEEKGGKSCD